MRPLPHPRLWPWLLPVSWLYEFVTTLRNKAFDWGWLPQQHFSVSVITVGNLAVGGTGKTPHTEYLLRLLEQKFRVATLSRGYGRKSKGFRMVEQESTAAESGDEPLQMKHKFPCVAVAVDENRRRGIQQLLSRIPIPEVFILDDALQHRYVQAGLNILLTDYSRLYTRDFVLPAGRLREAPQGAKRSNIIIVTKCPEDLSRQEAAVIRRELHLQPEQHLFFTTFRYRHPYPVFGAESDGTLQGSRVLAITGIAHPEPMFKQLEEEGAEVTPLTFPDHHTFSDNDINRINKTFNELWEPPCLAITTEKDAARLRDMAGLSPLLKVHLFALPIEVDFLLGGEPAFKKLIFSYLDKQNK